MKKPDPIIIQTMSGVFEPLTGTFAEAARETDDGEKSFSFSIQKDESNAHLFDLLLPKEAIIFENERYVIDPYDHDPLGTTVVKSIEARHEIFDILKAEYQTTETTGALRIRRALDLALANTGVTYTFVGADLPSEDFENFGRASALEMMQQIMDRFGVHYRISGRHLTIAVEIARYTDGQFRHGHNLKSIREHQDGSDIITYIEGWGRMNEETDQPIVKTIYESEHSGRYTDHETGNKRLYKAFFQDDRFTTQAGIDAEAARRASGLPHYHLEVEYEELVENGLKLHDFQLGDYIWAIHEKMQLDIQAKIISVERYPYENRSPVVELGSFRRDITDKINGLEQNNKRIDVLNASVAVARQESINANEVAKAAQQAVSGNSQDLSNHINDMTRHVTLEQVRRWDSNPSSSDVEADIRAVRDDLNKVDEKVASAQQEASDALNQANNRNRSRALFIGDGTQTVFTLPFSYDIGMNQLDVYVGYTKRISGTPADLLPVGFIPDYNETSTTQISFTDAPPINAPIEILIKEVLS
ncbi:phage tail protein [Shouchella miscanthi]|uniref:phage tail protein n=1 Tax=Shouchella miscanthi TaxID=2598861 RepID=UPI0011A069E1|nr:phage tail spike protein [Shouchella miscanthi]